jgi:chemotaxis protein histidine kinase CheA
MSAATKLVLEIERIGGFDQDGRPVTKMFAVGRDVNGRYAKAWFNGNYATHLHDSLKLALPAGEDIKTRRFTVEAGGTWETEKEPKKRDGKILFRADGTTKIYDRYFKVSSEATFLSGPALDLFRIYRGAKMRTADAEKLVKAGKTKEAYDLFKEFMDTLAKRPKQATPANDAELESVVAAATEGAQHERITPAADEPEIEARPIPDEESARAETPQPQPEPAQTPSANPEEAAEARLARTGRDFIDTAPAAAKAETKIEAKTEAASAKPAPAETPAVKSPATEPPASEPAARPPVRMPSFGRRSSP